MRLFQEILTKSPQNTVAKFLMLPAVPKLLALTFSSGMTQTEPIKNGQLLTLETATIS